ncbi:hypothetical protein BpHYR1_037180 [Brachionus plicatilis]|uniref:Uncharacterized protein n=1 Tax=Brachionus plicatilis TaxID=10195 RepID=A0A3M7P811_BRAPC|nr:hypothetical protein BpHYR1_037180 [Brachionus plicatilis]
MLMKDKKFEKYLKLDKSRRRNIRRKENKENSLNDAEPFENLVESTVHISSTSTNMDQTVQSTQYSKN